MATTEPSPVRFAQKIGKFIAAVAGSVVGVGTLAFATGFLAQRAQYDFMQVPFVFVDDWAYAETGLMALVRSIQLLVSKPLFLVLLAVASVSIVLSTESTRFRRVAESAHANFSWLCPSQHLVTTPRQPGDRGPRPPRWSPSTGKS